jgi:type VI secretion system protein ImpF
MAGPRLTPTLFDKLVADLEMDGLRADSSGGDMSRASLRYYPVPRLERFNEAALRMTIRRELNWLLNTTNLAASDNLEPYPEVASSVVNFGVPDLAGKAMHVRAMQKRAREIRDAIRAFEPRIEPQTLEVEVVSKAGERENSVTYAIHGDIVSAVKALPLDLKTDVEVDTGAATVRE